MQTKTVAQHYGKDHQRLDDLFHRFQELKRSDPTEAVRLFAEFKAGLERHILWEEEILFPRFDARFGHLPDSPTGVMRWEHQHLRRYVARIEQNLARHDTEAELVQVAFLSLLCSHNRKEEDILYPMLDRLLGEQERDRVFAEMKKTP